MKKITFYTVFLRRSTKLACLLACAVLCCASSAQEIDFQDKVAKPYSTPITTKSTRCLFRSHERSNII